MTVTLSRLTIGASALALITACQTAPQSAPAEAQAFNMQTETDFVQDRGAILAMAGDYRVRFDFTETVPLLAGYQLADEKVSGGFEVVRVIEDEGDLEDRQDWSNADVQKLDVLFKTFMIALNPPEEPLQSIQIVSGTDWDTAEAGLEFKDEVLQSAVETFADLEKFIGYKYVM